MPQNKDYTLTRTRADTYELRRVSEPEAGPCAFIRPVKDRTEKTVGWKLKPLVCMLGSQSKVWPSAAEAVAATKLLTPGQAKAAVAWADGAATHKEENNLARSGSIGDLERAAGIGPDTAARYDFWKSYSHLPVSEALNAGVTELRRRIRAAEASPVSSRTPRRSTV